MGKCEVFEQQKCLGCEGLNPELDINKLKWKCEEYRKLRGKNYDDRRGN